MDEILDKLTALLPELPPHLRRGARAILDRPQDVAITSMRSLAARAGVTPPTMLRLARRVGFANYEEFRAVFQRAVASGGFQRKAASLRELGARGGASGVVQGMQQAAAENIARSLDESQEAALARAADMLRRAPAIYAVGGGALHTMS